jgi:hypothetical protein
MLMLTFIQFTSVYEAPCESKDAVSCTMKNRCMSCLLALQKMLIRDAAIPSIHAYMLSNNVQQILVATACVFHVQRVYFLYIVTYIAAHAHVYCMFRSYPSVREHRNEHVMEALCLFCIFSRIKMSMSWKLVADHDVDELRCAWPRRWRAKTGEMPPSNKANTPMQSCITALPLISW